MHLPAFGAFAFWPNDKTAKQFSGIAVIHLLALDAFWLARWAQVARMAES